MNHARKLKDGKWFAWCFVCLLVGSFIILTSEVQEALAGQKELIGVIDQRLLALVVEHRTPALNAIAIDVTALGSGAGLAILTAFLCVFFVLDRRPRLAAHALLAAGGAAGLTAALKFYFERSRPDVSLRLVEIQGFSYPSGHSLASAAIYFTCAILIARPLPGLASRSVIWGFFLALIGAIGLTRIYLGVHFFSDVLAGVMVGIAWAALVEIGISHLGERWNTRI
ncbi:MAG: phosphatase PAP2 family protein [Burkholderiaceae bacterium]